MKDFEKLLTDLPKPAVEVPAFKRELWRELRYTRPASSRAPWLAAAAAMILAVGLGALATAFVFDPSLPASIHARLAGEPAMFLDRSTGERGPLLDDALLDDPSLLNDPGLTLPDLRQALSTTEASADLDRAFLRDWSTRQTQPVDVRSLESETVYTIRKYELSDGKRVLVFTELGSGNPSFRAVADSPASKRIF